MGGKEASVGVMGFLSCSSRRILDPFPGPSRVHNVATRCLVATRTLWQKIVVDVKAHKKQNINLPTCNANTSQTETSLPQEK